MTGFNVAFHYALLTYGATLEHGELVKDNYLT
ncbi:hypothetical protein L3N51_00710 [Metallosphaera sp. J1]|nr:hypothetical protein [Metallosphaera javensis (ex Hofmann et al. 2022)]